MCGTANPASPWRDRYGFEIGICRCACGFAYLDPQLTPEGYAAFYQGPYRALCPEAPDEEARRVQYGEWLAKECHEVPSGCYVLDAGGSSWGMTDGWDNVKGWCWMGRVDPSVAEETSCEWRSTLETLPVLPTAFDVVLCAQTIDHCYDPVLALKNLHAVTKPGGWLVIDYVPCGPAKIGKMSIQRLVTYKVDHPCYWTEKSLTAALTQAGWTVKRSFNGRKPITGHEKGVVICQKS